jgi:ureidoacrylate peracid hydrolase
MHRYVMPQSVKNRVLRRQGKLLSHDTIDAARTALIVIDMQNYFVTKGFPAEIASARGIVPNINKMARAIREAGGSVMWVQTTATGALEQWGNHHKYMLTPERVQKRLAHLDEASEGFKLYSKLEPLPTDLWVKKIKFSAFIATSSDIDARLKNLRVESVLIAGTATNVCCESSARDAMLLDYRVIMLSDGNAAKTDEEHAATLNSFAMFFGDVMSTDEAIARIRAKRKTG